MWHNRYCEESVKLITDATSNHRCGKLAFKLADRAKVAAKTSSIQRDMLMQVDRCHALDAKYRHQLAVKKPADEQVRLGWMSAMELSRSCARSGM